MDLTVMLPTYNEELTIGRVIDEIRSLPIECEILIGDGNSSDRTYSIAESMGVTPISIKERGKGNAIRKLIREVNTPYVIMINADYTYPIKYTQLIFKLLSMEYYDVVIGCRLFKEKGSMSSANTLGNFLLSMLASILYRYRIYDVCSGMWGFKKEVLDKFNVTSGGFTLEADFFSNSVKNKCKIIQIPIEYRARPDGSLAKLKVWDGFKIAWFLIKRRLIG